MAEAFSPLVIPSRAADAKEFTPFAITLMKGAPATTPAAGPVPKLAHAAPPGAGAPACSPIVTLQRSGDVVSGIRIQCSCGQVIELNCVYGE